MKKINLTNKVLIGLFLGAIAGNLAYLMPAGQLRDSFLLDGLFLLLGQVFLRSIMMLVVPLVFVSLVNGVASMGDVKKLGRIGLKTIGFYMATTALALVIALFLGWALKPGSNLSLEQLELVETSISEKTPMVEIIYEMIPGNPFRAMVEGNMLQIIVFAILVGVGLSLIEEEGRIIVDVFKALNQLVLELVELVMLMAPLGVFGLMARTFASVGHKAVLPLINYVLVTYLGLIIHMVLVYGGLLKLLTGLPVRNFYKKFFPVMSLGFSTASSSATIPLSLDTAENKLGISKSIASFTIPLGSTINMDGTAIMQGVATFFIAQVYNIDLSFKMILTLVITATLASIGTAGVPGAGPIMLSMVLQSVGLPIEGIGLIMGIDRLVDMGRTVTNITGDAVCTAIIADAEKELDRQIFKD